MIFMNSKEDIAWAQEVHGVPADAKSLILYGNEDAPDKIEWWPVRNPKYDDTPRTMRF